MINQPPNSPDFNVNDLGFFSAIQSQQLKAIFKTISQFMENVQAAYDNMEPTKLNDRFLTLQKSLECSIEVHVGNNYEQPHLSKAKYKKAGIPMTQVVCESATYNIALNILNEE